MENLEIILIAFALSVDAFAVSMAVSAAGRVYDPRSVFRLAFHFGLFQFLMPVIGWAAGATLERLIASVDHWVAFVLLMAVGLRMLHAAVNPKATVGQDDPSRGLLLVTLSTAVSVDALAVGLSLGMLRISIWTPGVIIGVVTASMSLVGILIGARLHARFGRFAELIGGLVLISIAIRIVVTHLDAA